MPGDTPELDEIFGLTAQPAAPVDTNVPELDDIFGLVDGPPKKTSDELDVARATRPAPIEPGPILKQLQDVTDDAWHNAPARTVMDYLRVWGAQGDFTQDQLDDARAAALPRYGQYASREGIDKMPGMQREKKQLQDAHLAVEIFSRLPVPDGELGALARSTLIKMIKRRTDEIGAQQGRSGQGAEEAQRLYGVANQLSHLTEGEARRLYASTLTRTSASPVNSQEAKLLEEAPDLGERVLDLVFSKRNPPGEGPLTITQREELSRDLFGQDFDQLFRQEMVNEKAGFLAARKGMVRAPDGTRAGQTADGLNFSWFVPGGTRERLATAKVQYDPGARDSILKVRQERGAKAAAAYQRALEERVYEDMGNHLADRAAAPTEAEPDLTPYQRAQMNGAAWLADKLGETRKILKKDAEFFDNLLSSSRFVRETFIPSLMKQYAPDLAGGESVRNLAEAWTGIMRANKQLYQETGQLYPQGRSPILDERMKQFGLDPTSEAGRKMVRDIDQAIAPGQHEYWKNAYADIDAAQAYFGRMLRGLEPFDFGKMVGALGHLAYQGLFMMPAEQVAGLVDDPHGAAADLAIGYAMGKVTAPVATALHDAQGTLLNGWRLKTDLRALAYDQPQVVKYMYDRAKQVVADGIKTGTGAEKLNNMVAALETFMERRGDNGVSANASEVASVVRRAWPELKDSLGDWGGLVGSKAIPRNFVGQIGRALGLIKRPSKKLTTAVLQADQATQPVLRALGDLLGSGPEAQAWENSIKEFVKREGRSPTHEEAVDMAPEGVADLVTMAYAAQRHGPEAVGAVGKLWRRMTGGQEPDFMGLVGSVEDMTNRYMAGTLGLIDSDRRWGLHKDRATLLVDTAAKRLDLHSQQLELTTELLRRRGFTRETNPVLAQAEDELFATQRQTQRLGQARDRIVRHDASAPWEFMPEDAEILFAPNGVFKNGLISGETMEMLVRLHPGLFEGVLPESLYQTKRGPLKKDEEGYLIRRRNGLEEQTKTARAASKKADKEKVTGDRVLGEWTDEHADLTAELDGLKDKPATDPLVVEKRAKLADVEQRIKGRTKEIEDGLIVPDHVAEAKVRLDTAVEGLKAAREQLARRRSEGTVTRELDQGRFQEVVDLTRHAGLTEAAREGVNLMRGHREQAAVLELAGRYGNPYDPKWLPVQQKARLIHDALQSTGWRFQQGVQLAGDYAEFINRLPQAARDVIGEAQRTGRAPTELFDKYPGLEQFYKDAGRLNTVKSNITGYVEREAATFADALDMMEEMGWAPKHVVDEWRKPGYNPRIYAGTRRKAFVTRKKAKQALQEEKGLGAHPELAAVAQDREELMFRREPGKYRVRVVESDRVVDKLFDTAEDMNVWMDEVYGRDAWKNIGAGNKVQRGKTTYNEPIEVGHPLTDAERVELGEVPGHTPEKRLLRMDSLLKNNMLNAVASVLNAFEGMVVDETTYLRENLADFGDQYVKVRDNPEVFGNLAGKYVHRRVLKQLKSAAKTWETVQGLADGYMEMMEEPSHRLLQISKVGKAIDDFAKSNLILKSWRTWGANVTFQALSAALVGATRLFSPEGLGLFWESVVKNRPGERLNAQAIASALPKKLKLSPLPQNDPLDIAWSRLSSDSLQRARQHGLVGGLFESENEAMREMGRRIFGLTPEDSNSLKQLLLQRSKLRKAIRAEKLMAGGGQTERITRLDRDIVAIEEALSEQRAGWLKKTGRKLASFFLEQGKRDAIGRPTNQWWTDMKRFYNHIDEATKLLMFQELTDLKGMPDRMAAARVKMFSQDYAGLPTAVRRLARSSLSSLVTSFPAEGMRIGMNALLHEPMRYGAIIGMLPFLNLAQFAKAGIPWDRAMAMLDARGKKGEGNGVLSLFSDLYITDPTNRSIAGSVGLGNMLPFGGLFEEKGLLGAMYDRLVPPEKRDFWGQAGALGAGLASNFVGSSPRINWMGYLLSGRDPRTGQQLVDDSMTTPQKIRAYLKMIGRDILPPMGPGGRDYEAWDRAGEAGVSPKTGRLRGGAEEKITAAVRGLTGVVVRGKVAENLAKAVGIGVRARDSTLVDDNDLIMSAAHRASREVPRIMGTSEGGARPADGEYNEMYDLILRTQDPGLTEEQRQRAEKDAEAMYKELHTFEMGAVKGATSVTDREFRLFKAKVLQDDPADYFATLPPHVQAVALANLDQWKVAPNKLQELVNRIQFSDTGSLRIYRDPELLQWAVGYLDQRIKEPGHSPHLDAARQHFVDMQAVAEALETGEAAAGPAKEIRKKAVREALSK